MNAEGRDLFPSGIEFLPFHACKEDFANDFLVALEFSLGLGRPHSRMKTRFYRDVVENSFYFRMFPLIVGKAHSFLLF